MTSTGQAAPRAPDVGRHPLPLIRDARTRRFFVATVALSIALMAGIAWLREEGDTWGLSFIFMKLFMFQDHDALLSMLLTLAVVALLPAWSGARGLLRWLAVHPWRVCVLTACTLCAGSRFVYHAHPVSMDEYAAVFQSEVFASGHLTGRFPIAEMNWLIPEYFQNVFLRVSPTTGAVMSTYWPSFALLLTPFTWLGIPWACNPVLSALTVAVIRRIAMDLFDSTEAAGLAMLFTLASPVFFADGISFYSMTAHMLLNGVYVLLLFAPSPGRLLLAGVVGSVALTLHNPLPHTLFALPWIAWLAWRGNALRDLATLAAGYLPLCTLLLAAWVWFASGLGAHTDPVKGAASLATWPTASIVMGRVLGAVKVWIWAVPGLALLAGAGLWRWRHDSRCVVLAGSAALTYAAYFFFSPDQGHGWGFRYFHSAWLAMPLLAAGALQSTSGNEAECDHTLKGFMTVLALSTLVVGTALRGIQVERYVADDLAQLPAYAGTEPRVVFVDPRTASFGDDLVQNDPFLRDNEVRMILSKPAGIAAMMSQFRPGFRRVYVDRHGEVWSALPAPR